PVSDVRVVEEAGHGGHVVLRPVPQDEPLSPQLDPGGKGRRGALHGAGPLWPVPDDAAGYPGGAATRSPCRPARARAPGGPETETGANPSATSGPPAYRGRHDRKGSAGRRSEEGTQRHPAGPQG